MDEFPDAEGFGGYAGKSIQDYIRDDIDKALVAWETHMCDPVDLKSMEKNSFLEGLVKGMCHVLAKLRGTKMQTELDESYDRVEEKENKESRMGENQQSMEEGSEESVQRRRSSFYFRP